jgi:hypothetical protein
MTTLDEITKEKQTVLVVSCDGEDVEQNLR